MHLTSAVVPELIPNNRLPSPLLLFFFLLPCWDRFVLCTVHIIPKQALYLMEIRTVKVNNVSLGATENDLKEFFSFSGEIEYIEIQGDNERSQIAYVTFKNPKGAETSVLLSGATIVDQSVTIDLAPDYKLPAAADSARPTATDDVSSGGAAQTAEDVVSSMLAKGFVLGKDAINKAKAFDEKHQLTSTATATVTSLDQKIGLTEKISAGTSMVNDKVREMDEKFQVSEKTKNAFSAAEQTVSSAGSAIMKNRYILTGTSWVTDAYNRAAKAAGEVGQKTMDKVSAEEEGGKKVEGSSTTQITQVRSPEDATH